MKLRQCLALWLVVATVYLTKEALAITRYVSTIGSQLPPYTCVSCAARSIQPVINASVAGDIVMVYPGTYTLTNQINLDRNITIKSVSGSGVTTITANNACRIFWVTSAGAVIDGFTLTKGFSGYSGGAGAVTLVRGGVVKNCIITASKAHFSGGGIDCFKGGIVDGCTISGNESADYGGGISCYNGGIVINSIIENNHAIDAPIAGAVYYGVGGGIFMDGSNCVVRNCRIRGNTADSYGGGIYLENGAEIHESEITGNYGGNAGGVFCNWHGGRIRKCRIEGNSATGSYVTGNGRGGGVELYWAGSIEECTIANNYAGDRGGGVWMIGNGTWMVSSRLYGNTAEYYGGGILIDQGGMVQHCTLIRNTALNNAGGGLWYNNGGTIRGTMFYDNSAPADSVSDYAGEGATAAYFIECRLNTDPGGVFNTIAVPTFNNTDNQVGILRPNSVGMDFVSDSWAMRQRVDGFGHYRVLGWPDLGAYETGGIVNDYNYAGKAQMTVVQTVNGAYAWYAKNTGGAMILNGMLWGFPGCIPVPGDYNADGRADLAVFHPPSGKWYIRAKHGEVFANGTAWGFNGCIPVAGDYNGDGKADLAVYHPSTGRWYIGGVDGTPIAWNVAWGFAGCVPVAGDYNCDGKADLALFHAASGTWYILEVSGKVIASGLPWGFAGCTPVSGDYDGDGRADLIVFHNATGKWFIRDMTGNIRLYNYAWGFNGSTPMVGDYNGGGLGELSIYHQASGKWFIIQPKTGVVQANGLSAAAAGAIPVKL